MDYRVTHKWISRVEGDERVVYERGDAFEPTDAEISAYGDRLSPVGDTDDTDAQNDPGDDEQTPVDDTDDTPPSIGDIDLGALSYQDLQQLANGFDDIPGNLPKGELRDKLATKQ